MSPSRSYHRDTASESPREGDFFPRQLYDNLQRLEEEEEHETCDKQKDPIVNIRSDTFSSALLNTEICASLMSGDLENVCAATLSAEQPIKESELDEWVEKSMTSAHRWMFYIVCINVTFSFAYGPSETSRCFTSKREPLREKFLFTVA